jgi:hypothetical protein
MTISSSPSTTFLDDGTRLGGLVLPVGAVCWLGNGGGWFYLKFDPEIPVKR